jgi:hypothetical protein
MVSGTVPAVRVELPRAAFAAEIVALQPLFDAAMNWRPEVRLERIGSSHFPTRTPRYVSFLTLLI